MNLTRAAQSVGQPRAALRLQSRVLFPSRSSVGRQLRQMQDRQDDRGQERLRRGSPRNGCRIPQWHGSRLGGDDRDVDRDAHSQPDPRPGRIGASTGLATRTLGFGIAWAILTTRAGVVGQRSPFVAWISLATLMVAPFATVRTLWPLHMAFYFARPKLELLADQIESGQVISFPQWVGPFRLAGSKVDVRTGNVGLVIYPNPNGPTGFVRVSAATANQNHGTPIRGDIFEVELGPGWWYHEED